MGRSGTANDTQTMRFAAIFGAMLALCGAASAQVSDKRAAFCIGVIQQEARENSSGAFIPSEAKDVLDLHASGRAAPHLKALGNRVTDLETRAVIAQGAESRRMCRSDEVACAANCPANSNIEACVKHCIGYPKSCRASRGC